MKTDDEILEEKTTDEYIKKVEKGCGKIYKLFPFKYENVVSTCGDNRLHKKGDELNLCPTCKAKLEGYKLGVKLKQQADDRKFEDWKKRLKEEINKIIRENKQRWLKYGKKKASIFDTYLRIKTSLQDINFKIDKLSGFNNDDEREGER